MALEDELKPEEIPQPGEITVVFKWGAASEAIDTVVQMYGLKSTNEDEMFCTKYKWVYRPGHEEECRNELQSAYWFLIEKIYVPE